MKWAGNEPYLYISGGFWPCDVPIKYVVCQLRTRNARIQINTSALVCGPDSERDATKRATATFRTGMDRTERAKIGVFWVIVGEPLWFTVKLRLYCAGLTHAFPVASEKGHRPYNRVRALPYRTENGPL